MALAIASNPDGSRVVDISDWPYAIRIRDVRSGRPPQDRLLNLARFPIECGCGTCSHWNGYAKVQEMPFRGMLCQYCWAAVYARAGQRGVAIEDGPTLDDWGLPYDPREATKREHREALGKVVEQHGGAAVIAAGLPVFSGGYKRIRRGYDDSLYRDAADFYAALLPYVDMYPEHVRVEGKRGNEGFTFGEYLFAASTYVYHKMSLTRGSGWCNEFLVPNVRGFEGRSFPGVSALAHWMRSEQTKAFLDDVLLDQAKDVAPLGGMLRLAGDLTGTGVNKYFIWRDHQRPGGVDESGNPAGKPRFGPRDLATRPDGSKTPRPYWTASALVCTETLVTAAVDVQLGNGDEIGRMDRILRRVLPQFAEGLVLGDTTYGDKIRRTCVEFGWLPATRFRRNGNRPPEDDPMLPHYLAFVQNPRVWKNTYNDRYKVEDKFSVVHELYGAWVRCHEGCGAENEVRMKHFCDNIRMKGKITRCYDLAVPTERRSPAGLIPAGR
jgi:hypothetical protein